LKTARFSPLVLLFAVSIVVPGAAQGGAKLSFYGVHMDPSGQDAQRFSHASFGAGVHASASVPQLGNALGVVLGVEVINMLSEIHAFSDPQTGLRVEQQTSQDYIRVFLGPEIGPHGDGFFRPHVGAHIAVINYSISTDVVVPDDVNRENEIRQNLSSRSRTVCGYDLSADADLNFGKWFVEGGTRFAKAFNVPQQLGDGAVTVHPGYIQIYAGLGLNFQY
jgi:hypothetical protein